MYKDYMQKKFVMGVSMERVPGQQFSGLSSRQGDLIYAQFTGMTTATELPGGSTAATSLVDRIWVTVINDQIAELSAAGCTVFD